MTQHTFEHPLNEKTRIYLRIESLLAQLQQAATFANHLDYQLFFHALFDLLDISDQIQLRSELAKDVEKQRLNYRTWVDVEGVDQEMLAKLLSEIDHVHANLMNGDRFGSALKDDRFLSTLRQRFNLPGGTCCFDLPTLFYWLQVPAAEQQRDAERWMTSLMPLAEALSLWLRLTRETGDFHSHKATSGFYQSDASEASILRLDIPHKAGVYPMISGHKNRFAIKFIDFQTNQATTQDVTFKIAVCH